MLVHEYFYFIVIICNCSCHMYQFLLDALLIQDVIRFLSIRVDELEEGPSAQMRKQDRERRGRRERENV